MTRRHELPNDRLALEELATEIKRKLAEYVEPEVDKDWSIFPIPTAAGPHDF